MDVTRREALRRLAGLVGGALSAPALGAVLAGCRAEPPPADWTPRSLTADELDLVGILVDRIIPPTDTPGARAAGVPVFIDTLLGDWAEVAENRSFHEGLASVDEEMRRAAGVAFRDASAGQQTALLARLDEEAIRAREDESDPPPFFALLKEWTLVGYYTSEAGATEELRWLASPGRYEGDLPLEEVGRTWA